MASNYLVLGQTNPASATLATLYTVPSSTQAVVSSIVVCNTASTSSTFRIAVRPDGASIQTQHYLAYDVPISANSTIALTLGVTLGDTDVVTVRSSSTDLSFAAFGSEITA